MTGFNIANMFIAAARRWCGQPALEAPELSLSHEATIRLVMQMARHLREYGVKDGDHVGVALASGPPAIVAMVAIWVLGAVAIPLDFRSRTHERQRQVRSLNIRYVIESRGVGAAEAYVSVPLRDDWIDVLSRYSYDVIIPPSADHPAILSLTSGTTGVQQAMKLEHHTWCSRYFIHLLEPLYDPGVRFYNPIPISYAASRNQSLTRLLTGGTVIFSPPLYSPSELVEEIGASRANVTALVPTILRDLIELAKDRSSVLLPDLDWLHCGGASISRDEKDVVRQRLCPNFLVRYGTSGTGNISIQTRVDFDRFPDSVGKPHDILLVEIVDEKNRQLPAGEIGAIRVRSPGNVVEIYGAAPGGNDGSGDRISGGWVYPGDFGSLNADGYLTLHGRSSNMIIRGGANVYPAELEGVLNSHPAVKHSAVVGQPSKSLGEEIVAFVETDGSVTQNDLAAYCLRQFSSDKRPRDIFIVDELPRNASGKILHRELAVSLPERD